MQRQEENAASGTDSGRVRHVRPSGQCIAYTGVHADAFSTLGKGEPCAVVSANFTGKGKTDNENTFGFACKNSIQLL